MTTEEVQKFVGYLVGSSLFGALLTKVLEHLLNERKERNAAKRTAAAKLAAPPEVSALSSPEVAPILWRLLGDYVPEGNVLVVELLPGDKRVTISCEACMVRGQARRADLQNMLLSAEQLNLWEQMRANRQSQYFADVAALPVGGLHDYFDYYQVRSAYYAGLFAPNGRLCGMLGITSPEVDFLEGAPRTGIEMQVQNLQNLLPNEPAK